MQLIASRLFESRDLGATLDQVAADEMVANFFSVDFQTLDGDERALLEQVARDGPRTRRELAQAIRRNEETVEPLLYGLRMMGYLTAAGRQLPHRQLVLRALAAPGDEHGHGTAHVISGVNRVYSHAGRDYHLQAEDLGAEQACFEVRVYDGGTVLWRKRMPYGEILEKKLPKLEQDESLRALMEKTLHTVQAAIAKGKLA